ncbi:HEAT repeat domain-containing protein [Treponema primitia]|uniref:HEAT repeat domain-containing protein n=1 Tax=Treponema primitia TaxID=88058 RepID=UPI000255521B|nr:HEAT repeat domain-containing protein [Treponema primitia]
MKKFFVLVLFCLFLFQMYSQEPPDAQSWGDSDLQSVTDPVSDPSPVAPAVLTPAPVVPAVVPAASPAPAVVKADSGDANAVLPTEDAKRLETIRYGTETEIATLIQTLKNENTATLDSELITVARNTRNRNILSGVFSFFGDRDRAGLEDRALKAIAERDDEANETVLAALSYLGNIKFAPAVPYIQELLDAEEQRFISACIKALGLIGGSMPAGSNTIAAAKSPPETKPEDELGETTAEDTSEPPLPPSPPPARTRKEQESAAAVAEYLIDFYNDRSPGEENRREIIIALGDVKSPAGVPLLREIAENNDERAVLRMSALEALAKIGDTGGLDAVLLSVESADPNVRSTAVAALGPFAGPEIDGAILEAFRDSYYKTRMAAAQAARDRRLVEAVPYLRYRAERDDVQAVKDEAIKALGAIGNQESLDFLSSLFTERKNADRIRLLSAEMLLQNNANTYTAKVIEELDEAKRKNQTPLYNGFLRILGSAKTTALEDLARRFFSSGGVVEKSYALDMVLNNEFRSLAEQVRELTDEKYGSLSRKSRVVVEKLGL